MLEFLIPGSVSSTCLVGMVAGLVVYWAIQKWKYRYPPGPPGLPLLGNASPPRECIASKLHEQAFEWSKRYGPVITVRTGPIPIVIVNSIDTAMEVLVKKSTDFAGRMLTPSFDKITYGGKDIALGNYGPTWKLHRQIASKALRHFMQGDALQTRIHDAVETAFVEIDKLHGEFDPSEYITYIVSNILTGLCFGGKYNFNDTAVTSIIEKEDITLEKLILGTWEDFIPGLKYVYRSHLSKTADEFLEEGYMTNKLREAEKTFNEENIRHFTDAVILARMKAKETEDDEVLKSLTEQHLLLTIADIFFGGVDSSKLTLQAAILHMIAFPDIQERVQAEIDRVVGRDRLPGLMDRSNLSYTEAVLHESMRFGTAAPLGIQHMTLCDTEIAGYRIPKGTVVAVNQWALHHDPDAWQEVDRFIPERYLEENGKLGPKPKNWLPFSAGKRVCLGEFVAKPELHLIFASLMQGYRWKMVSGKCPDFTEVGRRNTLGYKPYKVIVEKRI